MKNPVYISHRIARPMRIEAPIQKETYKDISKNIYEGELDRQGGLWHERVLLLLPNRFLELNQLP